MMKHVYVAGPYRAGTPFEIEQNIQLAWNTGVEVAKLGAFPVVPHAMTAHMDGVQSDAFWLEGTLRLCRSCDAILLMPRWETSHGAQREALEMIRLGKRLLRSLEELEKWLHP